VRFSFRSVGARLSLALAVVVAGALAVVWVVLVPTLQNRLVKGRIGLLAESAREIVHSEPGRPGQDFIDDAARTADANRAILFSSSGAVLFDSRQTGSSQDVAQDPVALRAAESLARREGVVHRAGEPFAEVAVPDRAGHVLLVAASPDALDCATCAAAAAVVDVAIVSTPRGLMSDRDARRQRLGGELVAVIW